MYERSSVLLPLSLEAAPLAHGRAFLDAVNVVSLVSSAWLVLGGGLLGLAFGH